MPLCVLSFKKKKKVPFSFTFIHSVYAGRLTALAHLSSSPFRTHLLFARHVTTRCKNSKYDGSRARSHEELFDVPFEITNLDGGRRQPRAVPFMVRAQFRAASEEEKQVRS